MADTQTLNLPTETFPEKAAPIMNAQGEAIQEVPSIKLEEQPQLQVDNFDDVIELGDTALAPPADCLYPPTDDGDMEHKIIGCGHVLKSTHDLARWSEKTGARRVNTQESIDSVSDIAINLERTGTRRRNNTSNNNSGGNRGGDPTADIQGLFNENKKPAGARRTRGNWRERPQPQQVWQQKEGEKSEVIQCWPVLKSTHDQALLSEKRGKNAVNKADTSGALDELCLNQTQGKQESGQSQILQSWPVLKSTHDQATISEKNTVNSSGSCETLEEVAQNQGIQAGGNLQTGLDTQAGSHIQMDNKQ